VNQDPRRQLQFDLTFKPCPSAQCDGCDKSQWCDDMHTVITMLSDRVYYRDKACKNCRADTNGDEYRPGLILGDD